MSGGGWRGSLRQGAAPPVAAIFTRGSAEGPPDSEGLFMARFDQ